MVLVGDLFRILKLTEDGESNQKREEQKQKTGAFLNSTIYTDAYELQGVRRTGSGRAVDTMMHVQNQGRGSLPFMEGMTDWQFLCVDLSGPEEDSQYFAEM